MRNHEMLKLNMFEVMVVSGPFESLVMGRKVLIGM